MSAGCARRRRHWSTPLADVLAGEPELPRVLGMVGCPRCHTDDADFLHTAIDRKPSPFYDRELNARGSTR